MSVEEIGLHVNIGATFGRRDGTRARRGQTFLPTAEELRRFKYKLRPIDPRTRPLVLSPRAVDPAVPAAPEAPVMEWPMRMAPALYLQVYPDGPHAALAQKLIGEQEDSNHGD